MFGLILKQLRQEKKLSQSALAVKLNKGQSAVGMWESGKSYPDYATLIELANIFDVSVAYLTGETTIKEKVPPKEGTIVGTIQLAGRDGSFVKRKLTDEQLDIVKRMLEQMPDYSA